MSDERDTQTRAPGDKPQAGMRRSWWPGWIWAIPIAALLVVGWLGIRALLSRGEGVTITFDDAFGAKEKSTTIVYRGTVVGQVTGVELNDAGDAVTVSASIDQRATKFLRSGTRFWLRGANPSLGNLSSLGAVLSGPTIVMEPGPGGKRTHFTGLARQPIAPVADTQALLYEVPLHGNVGSLKRGDPVALYGFTVGEVRDVGFDFDPASGALSMPTTIALYPALFHAHGSSERPTTTAVRTELVALVQRGLRAALDRDPPLVGSYQINLEVVPGARAPAQTAATTVSELTEIPAAPDQGLSAIVTRLNAVPIEQIARNVLDITHHVDTLAASPKLKSAIADLAAALAEIHTTTATAGPQVTSLVATLRSAAANLEQTARSTNRVVAGTAAQTGIESTITEVTEAARAVRSLADYLDRHPEALVRGRQE